MARPSAAARNLSLMEELEKLDQSITLTLQEIDQNFSKAHRIVTTSIIPVVEHYGEHSRAVWEASKFWKQFFEASANVSLSGYEELANDDDSTMMEESTAIRDETLTADDSPSQAKLMSSPVGRDATIHMDDSLLDDAELSGSTPRLPRTKTISADTFSSSMRLEAKGQEGDETTVLQDEQDSTVLFAQRTARLPDMSLTPSGLREHTAAQQQSGGRKKDPLLHRILDKTYRVRTTPHRPGSRASPLKRERDDDGEETKAKAPWHDDDSLLSSPEMAPPTLRSEVFMSPYKLLSRQRAAATAARGGQGPRTPGVSVQTPATGKKSRNALDPATAGRGRAPSGAGTGAAATGTETGNRASRGGPRYEIDWESGGDDDDDAESNGAMAGSDSGSPHPEPDRPEMEALTPPPLQDDSAAGPSEGLDVADAVSAPGNNMDMSQEHAQPHRAMPESANGPNKRRRIDDTGDFIDLGGDDGIEPEVAEMLQDSPSV